MEFICDSITVTGGMMKYNEIEITVDRENKAIASPRPIFTNNGSARARKPDSEAFQSRLK